MDASNDCLKNSSSKSLQGSTGFTSNGQQQFVSQVAPGLELVVISAGKSFFLLRFAFNMTVALIECYIASTITDHNLAKISTFKINSTRNEEVGTFKMLLLSPLCLRIPNTSFWRVDFKPNRCVQSTTGGKRD